MDTPTTSLRMISQNVRTCAFTCTPLDQPGLIRQATRAACEPPLEIDIRGYVLTVLLRREQDGVAEDIERVHHARLPPRAAKGVR